MRSVDLEGFCEWREWPRAVIVNAPYKSGIYLFRIAGGKCFSRLKGESDIVYIGATPKGTIRNRLIHHKSSCSDTHYPLARIQEYLGTLEVAWVEYADAQEIKMQECVLLTRYGLDHIELPPANRQQSFRMASTVLRFYATASDQERAALIANLPKNPEKEAT
jgi:hypothetical protein